MTWVLRLTWLDLLLCAAFALPVLSDGVLGLLHRASEALALGPIEVPTRAGAFFVNLAGIFGVIWNVAMLTTTTAPLHRVDLVARVGVVGVIAYHIAASALSPLFALIVATECIGAAVKLHWLRTTFGRPNPESF